MFICKNCTPSLPRRSCCSIEEEIKVGDLVHREGRRCILAEFHPQGRKGIREWGDLIQRGERGCRGEQPHPQGKKRASPVNLACTPRIICVHIKSQKDNE